MSGRVLKRPEGGWSRRPGEAAAPASPSDAPSGAPSEEAPPINPSTVDDEPSRDESAAPSGDASSNDARPTTDLAALRAKAAERAFQFARTGGRGVAPSRRSSKPATGGAPSANAASGPRSTAKTPPRPAGARGPVPASSDKQSAEAPGSGSSHAPFPKDDGLSAAPHRAAPETQPAGSGVTAGLSAWLSSIADGADGRGRFGLAALGFAVIFTVLAGRAVWLATTPGSGGGFSVRSEGARAAAEGPVWRGDILDRRGDMLAISLESFSLYADPQEVWDAAATAEALAGVLRDFDEERARERMEGPGRFVWLKRRMSPRLRQAVFELGLPGLHFREEPRRVYPRGRLAAHALGYTTVDGRGLSGVEQAFDAQLAQGEDVRLSLDLRLQFALEEELRAAVIGLNADAAVGLVSHVRTGEILAMASLPDFDPHAPADSPETARFHRAAAGVYELGSVFKVFTYAMALDRGVVRGPEVLPTTAPIRAGRVVVTDPAPTPRDLTTREAFIRSSNVAAAYLAVNTPPHVFSRYLENFGLLTAPPLELSATTRPLTPPDWEEPARATISFGHGLAVTPVAFSAAFGAAVNGGFYVAPTLAVAEAGALAPRRVINPDTSRALTAMMRDAVREGTGRRADVAGLEVAGKTGTAEQPGPAGGYDPDHVIATFAAVFPASAPRYAVIIMMDRPQAGSPDAPSVSAAHTAAPVAGRVIARVAPLLGVPARQDRTAPMGPAPDWDAPAARSAAAGAGAP